MAKKVIITEEQKLIASVAATIMPLYARYEYPAQMAIKTAREIVKQSGKVTP